MADEGTRDVPPDGERPSAGVLRPRLVPYALSVGLTPLIPIPFLDDLVRARLVRIMLRSLAEDAGAPLEDPDVEALAWEPPSGCGGWLGGCLLYPVKRLLRKVLFVLEWKRAVDLTSRTYVYGLLVHWGLERGFGGAPARLREAAWATMAEVGTSPVDHAVRAAVAGGRGTLQAAANLVGRAVGRLHDPLDLDRALRAVEAEEREALSPVTVRLSAALQGVPESYLRRLIEGLERRLG